MVTLAPVHALEYGGIWKCVELFLLGLGQRRVLTGAAQSSRTAQLALRYVGAAAPRSTS